MKQRATLGYLLVHANQVVATSDLVEALWPDGDQPTTARKVLQNAVWGLRGALKAGRLGSEHGALLTKRPGYILRVDDSLADIEVFRRQAKAGRTKLAAGDATAAKTLREALQLWRGPALADLVECGVAWPELSAVESTRLDVMEDYFEAELAAGQHRAVLADLQQTVEAEPLRERLCGQLMLALYRSARQADALNVYGNVRNRLVEDLGLEPRRELQELQQRILNQDAGLSLPEAAEARERIDVIELAAPGKADEVNDVNGANGANGANGSARRTLRPAPLEAERRRGSILLVRADVPPSADIRDQRRAEDVRDGVFRKIRDTVSAFGGTVSASIGPVPVARFDPGAGDVGDTAHAVRAALALREALNEPEHSAGAVNPCPFPHSLQAAVATGETAASAVSGQSRLLHSVNDAVLHKCQVLLSLVPAGEIWVCEETRLAEPPGIEYLHAGDDPRRYRVCEVPRHGPRPAPEQRPHPEDRLDPEPELDILGSLLEHVRDRRLPHLVTAVGAPGTGKSRLLAEFKRRVMGRQLGARFFAGQARSSVATDELAVYRELVSAYCGGPPGESGDPPVRRLEELVRRVVYEERTARWLMTVMGPLLGPAPYPALPEPLSPSRITDALRVLLMAQAHYEPVIVTVDDLHLADHSLLDFIEGLSRSTEKMSLLILVAARQELFGRRPGWGSGSRLLTTLTMGPPAGGTEPVPERAYAGGPAPRSPDYPPPHVLPGAAAEPHPERDRVSGFVWRRRPV